MNYVYFVSFVTTRSLGFGNAPVFLDREITSIDDVRSIGQKITERERCGPVTILNFQLLRIEEAHAPVTGNTGPTTDPHA